MAQKPEAPAPETETKHSTKRPGHVRKVIHITEAAWAKITFHLDANDLNEDRWLTKQFTKIADGLPAWGVPTE